MQSSPLSAYRLSLWASCLLIVLLVFNSKVRYDKGDTLLCLLTSQTLLETGSVDLRKYDDEFGLQKITKGAFWMFGEESANHKIYYNYPIGTSLLAMPFVAAGKLLGMDMAMPHDDELMQRALCALVSVMVLLLLVRIARHWLSPPESLAAALIFFASTTLISTFNSALWSHNAATLFMCMMVLELLRNHSDPTRPIRMWRMGVLLFAAWCCRPTVLAMMAVIIAWVAWRQPRQIWKMLIALAGCFALFVLFSLWQYSRWIPKYYDPSWWKEKSPWFSHIPEYLFSPARGLFTFTPLLLLMFAGYAFKSVRKNLVYSLAIVAFLAHLILLTRHRMWYAGWCYGPRLFAEVMPFCFCALILSLQAIREMSKLALRKAVLVGVGAMTCFGLYVHSWQGLFNSAVYHWDGRAPLLKYEAYSTWNWRFPQFMASEAGNDLKGKEIEWLTATQLLADMCPPNAALLMGEPSPELFSFTQSWNRKRTVGDGKIYNHMKPLLEEGVSDFYFYQDRLEAVKAFTHVEITPMVPPTTLGEFVTAHRAHTLYLAIKDEGSLALSAQTRDVFRSLGSKMDSLKFRDGYLACIKGGKLEWEMMGPEAQRREWLNPACGKIVMASAGKEKGDLAEIQIKGLNRSMQKRGFNVVVVGDDCKVISIANFDTPVLDLGQGIAYKGHVTRKAQ